MRLLSMIALLALMPLAAATADEAAAEETAADDSAAAEAWFISPRIGESAYGPVELTVVVESEQPVLAVEFFVDGVSVGVDTAAPFRVIADLGYGNSKHQLRAVARITGGERVEALRSTANIVIDDTVDIELRELYVNVMSGGRPLVGLERKDFRILDGGVEQELSTFEHGEVPVTSVLMLDCSASMDGERFAAALSGARTFLSRMESLDEAKLLLFSDRLLGSTPFTADQTLFDRALKAVEPVGGTAINDYLYASLKALDGRRGRRVVVLFTDGSDLHSLLTMREVLWKAQRSQAVLYWIFLRDAHQKGTPQFNTAWRDYKANGEQVELLRKAVRQSGGHVAELDSPDQLEGAFTEIISELRQQYILGYYPHQRANRDGSWREVEVKVRKLGARVRTRQGYIDY